MGPKSVSYRYLSIGRSNKKKSKSNIHLIFNFASGRTFPTQSTGPQKCFLQISQCQSLKSKKFKRQYQFIFKFCFLQDFLHPVNWSPTHSTGPKPIKLVPKQCFLQISQYRSLKSKKFKKQSPLIFEFCFPNPFNWSPKLFFTDISVYFP